MKKHGLDFADASRVFAGHTLTRPDTRFSDGEARFFHGGVAGSRGRGDCSHRNRRHARESRIRDSGGTHVR
ncbi:MAG: hypothetical protein RKP46_17265 [Candidatus Accumulibacter sp.]|uniref:hypothetical protein n=1 Tax=Accumulibacter sp. TaxID=2053492 RepID=UPI0025B9EAAF|nr:hypothetical protein [Accumulibacter sp.]MDS4016081.1 hypothetical protein [Accumulibacter sp.]HRD89638.1 hypothetical protein [Accumulibacter sp.]